MLIYAENDRVTLGCQHCGAKQALPPSKSARGFMTRFNKFRRQHEWKCAPKAKHERLVAASAAAAHAAIERMQNRNRRGTNR